MKTSAAAGYSSGCQIARRITEAWGRENLYCVACSTNQLIERPCNSPATDFTCPNCAARYQLKAGQRWSERKIPDAGYEAMIGAIRNDQTPNLLVMQYTQAWAVHQLLLIPSFFFSISAIEKRRPLSSTARRAGWVGCNINLLAISEEGKLRVVTAGKIHPPTEVRGHYERLRPLQALAPELRGWTLDVLRILHRLGARTFSLGEIYNCESQLMQLHPKNQNVRAKIRQQLQVLRDLGLLSFEARGVYRLT